jgi:hypothetical protein
MAMNSAYLWSEYGYAATTVDVSLPMVNIITPSGSVIYKAEDATVVELEGNATDSLSGINSVEVAITDAGVQEPPTEGWSADGIVMSCDTECHTCTWSYSWHDPSASSKIWIRALDNAGNTAYDFRTIEVIPVIYVKPDGNDSNDGLTWLTAKKTITGAMNAVSEGCEIWVAAGTYQENVTLSSMVGLYGAFAGYETVKSNSFIAFSQLAL